MYVCDYALYFVTFELNLNFVFYNTKESVTMELSKMCLVMDLSFIYHLAFFMYFYLQ